MKGVIADIIELDVGRVVYQWHASGDLADTSESDICQGEFTYTRSSFTEDRARADYLGI